MDTGSAWRCSPARVSSRLLPSSTSRSMAAAGRCRPRPWPPVIICPPVIWSRCCRRWCAIGILKGIRGPRGGYELARERRRITADDILRAAGTIEDAGDLDAMAGSALLNEVVIPAVGQAERAFSAALGRINLDESGAQGRAAARRRRPKPCSSTSFRKPASDVPAGNTRPCWPPSPPFTIWTLSARFPLCVKSQ